MEYFQCSCGASTSNEDGICDYCKNEEDFDEED